MCQRWLTMQYSAWEDKPLDGHFGGEVNARVSSVCLIRQVVRLVICMRIMLGGYVCVCVCLSVCVCAYAFELYFSFYKAKGNLADLYMVCMT